MKRNDFLRDDPAGRSLPRRLPSLRPRRCASERFLTDTFAEAYYADDMGFFAKAGLTVEIQSFRKCRRDLRSGARRRARSRRRNSDQFGQRLFARESRLRYIAAGGSLQNSGRADDRVLRR